MNKQGKEKRTYIGFLLLSIFLLSCAAMNFAMGNIGAAIGNSGSAVLFFCMSLVAREKSKKDRGNRE